MPQVQKEKEMAPFKDLPDLPREQWDTWDPMLISEGLFSAANIFRSVELVKLVVPSLPYVLALSCCRVAGENLFPAMQHSNADDYRRGGDRGQGV